MSGLKETLEKIRKELPNVVAIGVIDVASGLAISGLAEHGIDIEANAAYFAHSLSNVLKASKTLDPETVLEEVMVVTNNMITLFLFAKGNYAVGVTVRSGTQLGLVRAVLKKYIGEIEKYLP